MHPVYEASQKGIAFSWTKQSTKKERMQCFEGEPVSKWRLAVMKWKYYLLEKELDSLLKK